QLAKGLAVARRIGTVLSCQGLVGAVALGQIVEELGLRWPKKAGHRYTAVLSVRGEERVEFASPVIGPVAVGVDDEHVAPGAAEGQVLIGRVCIGVRVERAFLSDDARAGEVVVEVDEVVAPTA